MGDVIAYGRTGLSIDMPDEAAVPRPVDTAPAADGRGDACRPPGRSCARAASSSVPRSGPTGSPTDGSYRAVLRSVGSPEELLDLIAACEVTVPDQWQVQIQARIQPPSRVLMRTSCLSDAELAEAHLAQTQDISATGAEELGSVDPGARGCVFPEGPQTIPYVRG